MKTLTNKHGFSEMMVDGLTGPTRNTIGKSDYSATSLINPPRMVQLTKRHEDEVESDIKDTWSMWLGSTIHYAIEKNLKRKPEKYFVEQKITRHDLDRRVVSIFDAYDKDTETIYDHKTTTVFIHGGEAKEEWAKQLNINAYFLEEEGVPVRHAKINAIYTDWRAGMAKFKKEGEYPQIPHAEVPVPILSQESRKEYYLKRLQKDIDAEELADADLPLCTAEEMWEKPTSYAVKQKNVYVAKRVLPTQAEAEVWMEQNGKKFKNLYIEKRQGQRVRCESYCNAAPFCNQYQKYLKEKAVDAKS